MRRSYAAEGEVPAPGKNGRSPGAGRETRPEPSIVGAALRTAVLPRTGESRHPRNRWGRVTRIGEGSEERRSDRRRLDGARRLDPRLVEQTAEDRRAARGEVVAVVVEHRVDLVCLGGQLGDARYPFLQL